MSRHTTRIRNLIAVPSFLAGFAAGVGVWAVTSLGVADLTFELNLALTVIFAALGLAGLYVGRGSPILHEKKGINTAKAIAWVFCLPVSVVSGFKALIKLRQL